MSAMVLTGLASLALAAGAPVHAVRLAAAASLVTGDPRVAGERWADIPGPAQIREMAAEVWTADAVARAWAEGQAMTLAEAIACAVGAPAPAR